MKPTDYPVLLIYSKEDNAWLARVDLLPGCVADGSTQEEALANVRIAIEDWIEVSKELKRFVPQPFDMQELENFQVHAMEQQGQQIQQLIQQAVAQAIQQFQSARQTYQLGSKLVDRSYQFPVTTDETVAVH